MRFVIQPHMFHYAAGDPQALLLLGKRIPFQMLVADAAA